MYVICSYRSEASCDEDHCMRTPSPQETQARALTETTGRYAFLSTRMASLRRKDLVSKLPNLQDLQSEAARCWRSQYSPADSLKSYGKQECKQVPITWTDTAWQRDDGHPRHIEISTSFGVSIPSWTKWWQHIHEWTVEKANITLRHLRSLRLYEKPSLPKIPTLLKELNNLHGLNLIHLPSLNFCASCTSSD
jgi:hypothetical protein